MTAVDDVVTLLTRMTDPATRPSAEQELERILGALGPCELPRLEEELASRGLPAESLQHLCSAHLKAAAGQRAEFRASLPDDHFLAVLMDEHVEILARLDRLAELATGSGSEQDLREIRDIGTFLVGMEPHHAREEEVLFPALRRHGLVGPPAVMEQEHVGLRALKHRIRDGATRTLDQGATGLSRDLRDAATLLVRDLRDHIFKEDSILYPMAHRVLSASELTAPAS